RHPHTRTRGRGGVVFWRLTSVALRAPSVSRQKGEAELSTLLRTGTFYFALTGRMRSMWRELRPVKGSPQPVVVISRLAPSRAVGNSQTYPNGINLAGE